MRACMRAGVRVCVCAGVRARVFVRVRACACVCVRVVFVSALRLTGVCHYFNPPSCFHPGLGHSTGRNSVLAPSLTVLARTQITAMTSIREIVVYRLI